MNILVTLTWCRLKAASKETKRLQQVMAEYKGQMDEIKVQEQSLNRQKATVSSRLVSRT